MAQHFQHIVLTQRELADAFAELARASPELIEEFTTNAEIQRSLIKNGETLIGFFHFIQILITFLIDALNFLLFLKLKLKRLHQI